jgi:hypothetical protein
MNLEIDVEYLLTHGPGYWYLSTPFTHFPGRSLISSAQ